MYEFFYGLSLWHPSIKIFYKIPIKITRYILDKFQITALKALILLSLMHFDLSLTGYLPPFETNIREGNKEPIKFEFNLIDVCRTIHELLKKDSKLFAIKPNF